MNFLFQLIEQLKVVAVPEYARTMQAYMKHKFVFFGVKAPVRKEILKRLVIATNHT